MREILFRGKTEEGKWLEGYLHKIDGIGKGYRAFAIQVQDIDARMCRPHSHEVIPETVGQFTGLTDKNGNKIFEGDYLVVNYQGNFLNEGFVEYNNKNYCWCIRQKNGLLIHFDQYGSHFIEVIGNIHNNKELLGE